MASKSSGPADIAAASTDAYASVSAALLSTYKELSKASTPQVREDAMSAMRAFLTKRFRVQAKRYPTKTQLDVDPATDFGVSAGRNDGPPSSPFDDTHGQLTVQFHPNRGNYVVTLHDDDPALPSTTSQPDTTSDTQRPDWTCPTPEDRNDPMIAALAAGILIFKAGEQQASACGTTTATDSTPNPTQHPISTEEAPSNGSDAVP